MKKLLIEILDLILLSVLLIAELIMPGPLFIKIIAVGLCALGIIYTIKSINKLMKGDNNE